MFVFSSKFSYANFLHWQKNSITNENICAVFYVAINAMFTKPESVWVQDWRIGGLAIVMWIVNAVLPSIDTYANLFYIIVFFGGSKYAFFERNR